MTERVWDRQNSGFLFQHSEGFFAVHENVPQFLSDPLIDAAIEDLNPQTLYPGSHQDVSTQTKAQPRKSN